MNIYLACQNCDAELYFQHPQDDPPATCSNCGDELSLNPDDSITDNQLNNCVVCGEDDFYKATQINPNFGITLVGLGTVMFLGSVYFVPGMRGFLWGMVVLLSLAVFDRVMRIVLPESVICYRCSTVYSNVEEIEEYEDFDHERATAIKYENS